ncbi:MAG TPA: M12 family metallo-peptidase [Terriglobales bacterium]|nr:M12 family metallo-peptidase [Terriglobales bacterium]
MITRRRTICSILSALVVSSCSLLGPEVPQRVVRIKVLADVPFRNRNPHWQDEARGLIEAASDYYEREFEIRLLTQSVSPWPEVERVPSTPALITKLKNDFPVAAKKDSYDLIVIFTAEGVSRYLASGRPRVDRIGNCAQGLGSYVVAPTSTIFHYNGPNAEPTFEVMTLVHELGHIFGAEHVDDTRSIMHEDFGYRTEFDTKNRAVIKKNRACAFAK